MKSESAKRTGMIKYKEHGYIKRDEKENSSNEKMFPSMIFSGRIIFPQKRLKKPVINCRCTITIEYKDICE